MNGRVAGAVATAAATGVALLAIALHVGLIPAASWGSDEFVTFALLRDGGFGFFAKRLVDWSPRPISDGVLWGYQQAVAATGRQLMVPFLLLVWSALPVAALAALGARSRVGWLLASAILALFLLGHPVGEAFYWPMGASAYVLGLAGITFVVLRMAQAGPLTRRGKLGCSAAMVLAAGSSEIGIVFVATLCVALFAVAAAEGGWRQRARAVGRLAWLFVPLAVCLVLGGLLATGRVAQGIERMAESPVYFKHAWPSLIAAAERLGGEFASIAIPSDMPSPVLERLDRVLFVVGITLCLRAGGVAPGPPARLFVLAAALGIAAFASLASAYHQFGVLCCERHATVRACLSVLLLVVLAFALARLRTLGRVPRRWIGIAGPVFVAMAVLLPLAVSIPALRADYASEHARIAIRDANWRAGHDTIGPSMTFETLSHGSIVDGFGATAGRTVLSGPASGFALGVMQYFGKSEVRMLNGP